MEYADEEETQDASKQEMGTNHTETDGKKLGKSSSIG